MPLPGINLGLDVGGVVDMLTNESKDQATANRDLSGRQWKAAFDFEREKYWWSKPMIEQQFDERHKTISNLVKDAQSVGISPLAALGGRPASPVSFPGSRAPAGQTHMPDVRMTNLGVANMQLDLVQKAANIQKTVKESKSVSPIGQQPQVPKRELEPLRYHMDPQSEMPGIEPGVKKVMGPGGKVYTVGTFDLEELAAGMLLEWLGHVDPMDPQPNVPYRTFDKRLEGKDWSQTQEEVSP